MNCNSRKNQNKTKQSPKSPNSQLRHTADKDSAGPTDCLKELSVRQLPYLLQQAHHVRVWIQVQGERMREGHVVLNTAVVELAPEFLL